MFRARTSPSRATSATRARTGVAVVAVGLLAVVSACGSSSPTAADPDVASGGKIVVGSFAFPESQILAEIYTQALQAKGLDVSKKFNIGPREQTIPALQDGSINLIPEYNGNLLAYYNKDYTQRTTADVDAALPEQVAADNLKVLDSAAAEDKDAYVVTSKTASDNDLTQIGDLTKLTPFALGASPQYTDYGYGIPGMKSVYGIDTSSSALKFVPIEDFGGPDTVKALVDDTVQVADIYTTSPALKTDNLVVLEDPESMISSQNVIPLLSDAVDSPQIEDILNAVSAALTTDDLIALRNRVEGDEKASAATAAGDWLKAHGLS